MEGVNAETTFDGGTILPIAGKRTGLFFAGKWSPGNLKDSRYLGLPVRFRDTQLFVEWKDRWDITQFENK